MAVSDKIYSGSRLVRSGFGSRFREAFLEALDAASGIDEHLLAGVERVAAAANVNLDVVAGGASFEAGAAVGAVDRNFRILWMNLWFHDPLGFRCLGDNKQLTRNKGIFPLITKPIR